MLEMETLKKTPLYDRHSALQGKIVNFGGWALPVYYSSILAEHLAVRKNCGIFDVSHLGEIHVKGPGAFEFLQHRLTHDLRKLSDGKIIYSLICDENGFTLDDILVYQCQKDDYTLIVNASGIERDYEALRKYAADSVSLTDQSDDTACVAVQGPNAESILEKIFGFKLKDLAAYFFKDAVWRGEKVWVSRSGYTGEDGFEIFSSNALSLPIWDALLDSSGKTGLVPAGLGARNTLRLEAGNVLYGNELDDSTTPLEAGLGWAVSFDKGDFVGREALRLQKEKGLARRLVGFRMLEKSIPREHYSIFKEGKKIGHVTSGSFAPSAGLSLGMGYVEKDADLPGTLLQIEIHGRLVKAEVVKLPFVPLRHKKG